MENERERMRIRLHTPTTVTRWLTDTDSTCYIQRMTLRIPAPQTGHHYEPVDLLAGLTLTHSLMVLVSYPAHVFGDGSRYLLLGRICMYPYILIQYVQSSES